MILLRSEGPRKTSFIPPHALSLLTMFHEAKRNSVNHKDKMITSFLVILEMNGSTYLLAIFGTDDDEIQDEEGVKSVAPPPTAHTDEATVACLVANCSL